VKDRHGCNVTDRRGRIGSDEQQEVQVIPGHPFTSAPDAGKLAIAGEWENAIAFAPGEYTEQTQALEYLGTSPEVACEAFFQKAFFGARRSGTPDQLAHFVTTFARAIRDARTGEDFFATLRRDLGVRPDGTFLYAELGAEGAWASVGPVRIDPLAPRAAALAAVAQSLLAHDVAHDKALEFTYDNGDGTTHWVAWPVSDDHEIDPALLDQALDWFARS
jgi:hypothetical protein